MRQAAVDFIRSHSGEYSGFFETTTGGLEGHLSQVSQVGVRGGQHEIDAISRHLNRNIIVHQHDEKGGQVKWSHGDGSLPPFHLAYAHGLVADDGHYDTVHYADDAAREAWISRFRAAPQSPQSGTAVDDDVIVIGANAPASLPASAEHAAAPTQATPVTEPAVTPLQLSLDAAASAMTPAHDTSNSGTAHVNGTCASRALSGGLRDTGVDTSSTPSQVQHRITGSEDPCAFLPTHFVIATRIYGVVLTFYRHGNHATQSIGAGSLQATASQPRIFLQLTKDGTHVELARNVPADALFFSRMAGQYVDVGTAGNGWMSEAV